MWLAASRFAVIAAVAWLASGPADAQSDIGSAARVENRVEGILDGMPQPLAAESRVFQDERITSHHDSSAILKFADDTTLSIGPSSEVVLDRFVYNGARGSGDIVFNAAKGAFRFVTGNAASDSYRVVTPHAVIGTRGTDYGVYVLGRGTVTIAHSGHALMCPTYLINDLDVAGDDMAGGGNCCSLNASAAGGALYGVMHLGRSECQGPQPWTGISPHLLLTRSRDPRDLDSDSNDRDAPSDDDDSPSRGGNQNPGGGGVKTGPG